MFFFFVDGLNSMENFNGLYLGFLYIDLVESVVVCVEFRCLDYCDFVI